MPHNIYLHSALVLSREIDTSDEKKVREANFYYSIESAIALFISFIINMFVVAVFAKGFFGKNDIGLSDAGELLGQKYGHIALYIWGIGLLAAGQSSTMTGTYAGQFVMQGFLDLKISPWKRVLITRSVAILPSLTVALLHKNLLDSLDEWINVLQSVQLPFALIPVLTFTSSAAIMGSFRNYLAITIFCWVISVVVIGINVYLVQDFVRHNFPESWWIYLLFCIVGAAYLCFILYLIGNKKWEKLRDRLFWRRKDIDIGSTLPINVPENDEEIEGHTKKNCTCCT